MLFLHEDGIDVFFTYHHSRTILRDTHDFGVQLYLVEKQPEKKFEVDFELLYLLCMVCNLYNQYKNQHWFYNRL